jgi:molybdopterin biosynthesis enzyme
MRDGWAVNSSLTQDASPYAPAPIPRAVRIDVGEPLPAEADAVAEIDAIVVHDGAAQAIAAITSGDGVLPAGADADGRTALVRAGSRLGAVAAAALAGAQVSRIRIREPRLRVVRSRADPIIDAAATLVARAIEAAGGIALPESGEGVEDALRPEDADAVIAIGGTGRGRNDGSVSTLARLGRVEVHGIALSPGTTAGFGLIGAASIEEPPAMCAKLTRKITSNLGLAELIPVRLRDGEAEPLGSGYLPLQTLAQSNGWILVPPEREGHAAGAAVMVRPWP